MKMLMSSNIKKIGKVASRKTKEIKFSNIEKIAFGIDPNDESSTPFIVLKYYQPQHQCFSEWNTQELKALSSFIVKLSRTNWQSIIQSGGKVGKKTGFGYTRHKNTKLPECCNSVKDKISEDIHFSELRVTQQARVHGFRVKEAFFIVLLDRNHDICPYK